MTCPLCGRPEVSGSWLGTTAYRSQVYTYLQCDCCGSLFCDPMPDASALSAMYSADYSSETASEEPEDEQKNPDWVIEQLKQGKPGVFIDYGCGSGELLVRALELGWEAVGVEYDPKVCRLVEQHTACKVIEATQQERLLPEGVADVLHLGDVIEHLTDLNGDMIRIMRLLKPGGLLLAQGPLEANFNLFTVLLKWSRLLKGCPERAMPPYHVLLATREGQEAFFRRFGLEFKAFKISEVSWPAPSSFRLRLLRSPRLFVLWLLRRSSQALTYLQRNRWGNRYLFSGYYGVNHKKEAARPHSALEGTSESGNTGIRICL